MKSPSPILGLQAHIRYSGYICSSWLFLPQKSFKTIYGICMPRLQNSILLVAFDFDVL